MSSKSDCLAVLVNSPGGSPSHSHNIYLSLRRHAEKTGKPVYTFAEEVAASGGYFVLSAGDRVFAEKSSVVGSIGAISMKLEVVRLLQKFGVKTTSVASKE